MKRQIEITKDGSTTLRMQAWDEPYHSAHGAIQESRHVFIRNGLHHCPCNPVRILEMGFGTGLNALLSMLETSVSKKQIHYTAIEAYPLDKGEVDQLNYLEQLNANDHKEAFRLFHHSPWEAEIDITPTFTLIKKNRDFSDIHANRKYDLIYYDAFGARVQPELWTEERFATMYRALDDHGILVTYAAKGSIRRAMLAAGFEVERLPGPPGKREMLRAIRKITEARNAER